jgi:predicted short-subunit dehydrogenase-like oxidoreductase (DUF2520 family)
MVFLAVPDQVLESLAHELASEVPSPDTAFIHLSGPRDLAVLQPLNEIGHAVGSFHPLQSFPMVRPPEAFRGSLIAVDASDEALLGELTTLAAQLGGTPRLVAAGERALYYAAAMTASNYLVALSAQATDLLVAAGWSRSDALAALVPLMRGALDNLQAQGLPDALIGPIRRGDAATVSRQVAELSRLEPAGHSLPLRLYLILGQAALELAREAGLEGEVAQRIAQALTPGGSDQEVTEP